MGQLAWVVLILKRIVGQSGPIGRTVVGAQAVSARPLRVDGDDRYPIKRALPGKRVEQLRGRACPEHGARLG